jgi:hypothetical protein
VDESAARNTQDVSILIRRSDSAGAKAALESVGFVHGHAANIELFLDGADARAREAVHLIFADEKVRAHEPAANPSVTESERGEHYCVLSLEALVRIKLTAFRDKDRTHLRDLIGVGLVDGSWTARLPSVLAERLQVLLDTPEG